MAETSDPKLRVFVSYARSDGSEFAEELAAGLEVTGFEPFLDQHDIAAGESWEARLGTLISSADTIVFVVTPASVESRQCAWEIERAVQLNKRILPVVAIHVAEQSTPKALSSLQYINFTPGSSFAKSLGELSNALRSDLAWVREHTRLGELAARWRQKQQSDALLLRGSELVAATGWLETWRPGAPEPTALHREHIEASASAENLAVGAERKRLAEVAVAQEQRERALQQLSRRTTLTMWGAAGFTVAAGGLAYWGVDAEQRFEREKLARETAQARSLEQAIATEAARTDISGQFVAYSAAPGREAEDSPVYSQSVRAAVENKDAGIVSATLSVGENVARALGGQRPYIASDLNGDIYLKRLRKGKPVRALVAFVDRLVGDAKAMLQYPEPEARAWERLLKDAGLSVEFLANPTAAELVAGVDRLGFRPHAGESQRPPKGTGALPATTPSDTLNFFFLSGFGINVEGQDMLIGTDAAFADRNNISGLVSLADIQRQMRDTAAASILYLDTAFPPLPPLQPSPRDR